MSSVSVIIPTFNAAPLIERTLRSVISQNGGHDIEIIIVDDASTDNTLDVIANLAIPSIKILKQDGNHGPAAARNRGLSEATGEFMAFLDGDDFWEPEFLDQTTEFLENHPQAVAVSVMQRHKTRSAKLSSWTTSMIHGQNTTMYARGQRSSGPPSPRRQAANGRISESVKTLNSGR